MGGIYFPSHSLNPCTLSLLTTVSVVVGGKISTCNLPPCRTEQSKRSELQKNRSELNKCGPIAIGMQISTDRLNLMIWVSLEKLVVL